MTYLERFRSQFATLMQTYIEATGARKTVVSEVVAGYPSFYLNCARTDFAAGKFDMILSRFSAIWPADLPWPAGIERHPPAEISDEAIKLLDCKARATNTDWPADQPWPADIPRPVASSQNVDGQGA